MKSTLRDEFLRNLTISESALKEIDNKLRTVINEENNKQSEDNKKLWLTYIIRFDKKGRSLFSFEEAINCYKNARSVERFIFNVVCLQSFRDRLFGKSIDVYFDKLDFNNCLLKVQGDDASWVDNTYSCLMEIIKKYKNLNFIFRSFATPFLVQITGVFLGVLLSIKGAQWLEPRLKIQYALPFAFVIVFLLFSNIWTYLYAVILRGIDKIWPNVVFKEKQNIFMIIYKWMINVILGFIFLAGIKSIFSFLVGVWKSIFQ